LAINRNKISKIFLLFVGIKHGEGDSYKASEVF